MVIVIAFFPDDSLEGSSTFLDTKPVIVYYIETYAVLVTVHCFVFIAIFSPLRTAYHYFQFWACHLF
jgi:hypothetical protein